MRASCLAYEESQTREKKKTSTGGANNNAEQCGICDASRFDEWNETHAEVGGFRMRVCGDCGPVSHES